MYKKPHTTFLDHLTQDNYFLNEKCNELYKMNEILHKNVEYLNKFIFSTYDICGNYISNLKIIAYDSSNNIISYICSDSSGNFSSQNKFDLSKNVLNTHLKNSMTESHIYDSSRCFPFQGHYGGYPYFPPYLYPYGYGYPYLYRDILDNDDDNRDISMNHIPQSPIHLPPIHNPLPIIHKDFIMDHSFINRDLQIHPIHPIHQIHPNHPIHYYNNHTTSHK